MLVLVRQASVPLSSRLFLLPLPSFRPRLHVALRFKKDRHTLANHTSFGLSVVIGVLLKGLAEFGAESKDDPFLLHRVYDIIYL